MTNLKEHSSSAKLVHASCVAFKSKGVLLIGKSGSGKSDLALRLIDRGAQLVSDDQVKLLKMGKKIMASAPENIKGLLEVRGLGIHKFPCKSEVGIKLVVQLAESESVERMPEPEFYDSLGIKIPLVTLYAFDVSTALKVEVALTNL